MCDKKNKAQQVPTQNISGSMSCCRIVQQDTTITKTRLGVNWKVDTYQIHMKQGVLLNCQLVSYWKHSTGCIAANLVPSAFCRKCQICSITSSATVVLWKTHKTNALTSAHMDFTNVMRRVFCVAVVLAENLLIRLLQTSVQKHNNIL